MASDKPSTDKGKPLSQDIIVNGFNELRNQQRQFVAKISEITDERKEYQLVLDTLKDMDKERTCFRMIGGVLVKKTVGEILPTLASSTEQMGFLLSTLDKQVQDKGKELVDYREKHNIRLQSEQPADKPAVSDGPKPAPSSGVLVNS